MALLSVLTCLGLTDVAPLAEGAQGVVYRATDSAGRAVAVKVAPADDPEAVASLAREARIMAAIAPHDHVLPLLSAPSADAGLLVTPLASGGTALQMMKDRGCAPLAESDARRLFAKLVSAVQHVHAQGFVHRDIKCENILLTGVQRRTLLLADFGFATDFVRGEKALSEACGSQHYASPEVIAQAAYEGPEVDVWSMGVVLYAWTTGRLPFSGATDTERCARILTGSFALPRHVSEPLADLLRGMLQPDPTKRLSVAQVLAHPWLSQTATKDGPERRRPRGREATSEIFNVPPTLSAKASAAAPAAKASAAAPAAKAPAEATPAPNASFVASLFQRLFGRAC